MTDYSELRAKVLKRFEGRDYVAGGLYVFVWHVHHDRLAGPLTEPIANRVDWIISEKPEAEIATRLEWLRPVVGPLPRELVQARADYSKAYADCDKACADYDKARADYSKACADYDKACADYDKASTDCDKAYTDYDKASTDCDKASADCVKAYADCVKACADYDKAYADYSKACADCVKACADSHHELLVLHSRECPGCPWDGLEMIFTAAEAAGGTDE